MARFPYVFLSLCLALSAVGAGWGAAPTRDLRRQRRRTQSSRRGRGPDLSGAPLIEEVRIGRYTALRRVTVSGSGFGAARRSVDLRVKGLRFSLPILSWSDTEVVAKLPTTIDPLFEGSVALATLFVVGPGGTRARQMELGPKSLAGDDPRILAAPAEIRAGEAFVVAGRNFGERPGSVTFFAAGRSPCTARVLQWTDRFLEVRAPTGLWPRSDRSSISMAIRPRGWQPILHRVGYKGEVDTRLVLACKHVSSVNWGRRERKNFLAQLAFVTRNPNWRVLHGQRRNLSGRAPGRYVWPDAGDRRTVVVFDVGARPVDHQVGVAIQGPVGTAPELRSFKWRKPSGDKKTKKRRR